MDVARALEELRVAQASVSEAERRLWDSLSASRGGLLAFLQDLGVGPAEATEWVIRARLPNGDSVLELLAEGREDEVRSALLRLVSGTGA
jgi:hypothetical protein